MTTAINKIKYVTLFFFSSVALFSGLPIYGQEQAELSKSVMRIALPLLGKTETRNDGLKILLEHPEQESLMQIAVNNAIKDGVDSSLRGTTFFEAHKYAKVLNSASFDTLRILMSEDEKPSINQRQACYETFLRDFIKELTIVTKKDVVQELAEINSIIAHVYSNSVQYSADYYALHSLIQCMEQTARSGGMYAGATDRLSVLFKNVLNKAARFSVAMDENEQALWRLHIDVMQCFYEHPEGDYLAIKNLYSKQATKNFVLDKGDQSIATQLEMLLANGNDSAYTRGDLRFAAAALASEDARYFAFERAHADASCMQDSDFHTLRRMLIYKCGPSAHKRLALYEEQFYALTQRWLQIYPSETERFSWPAFCKTAEQNSQDLTALLLTTQKQLLEILSHIIQHGKGTPFTEELTDICHSTLDKLSAQTTYMCQEEHDAWHNHIKQLYEFFLSEQFHALKFDNKYRDLAQQFAAEILPQKESKKPVEETPSKLPKFHSKPVKKAGLIDARPKRKTISPSMSIDTQATNNELPSPLTSDCTDSRTSINTVAPDFEQQSSESNPILTLLIPFNAQALVDHLRQKFDSDFQSNAVANIKEAGHILELFIENHADQDLNQLVMQASELGNADRTYLELTCANTATLALKSEDLTEDIMDVEQLAHYPATTWHKIAYLAARLGNLQTQELLAEFHAARAKHTFSNQQALREYGFARHWLRQATNYIESLPAERHATVRLWLSRLSSVSELCEEVWQQRIAPLAFHAAAHLDAFQHGK